MSCQRESERERIKKRKMDERKEGRKENNGRNAREEDLNKLHRNEKYYGAQCSFFETFYPDTGSENLLINC